MQTSHDENLPLSPAIMSLRALLPRGLDSLSPRVRRPLERDDYPTALKAANEYYAERGPEDRVAALTYAILLIGRTLIDEARGVLRRAAGFHADDVAFQLAQVEAMVVSADFESAQALLDALSTVSKIDARHWRFMGDMYLDMDNEDLAIECYELAIEQGVNDAE